MKTCPVCDGEGVCAYEEAVVDYEHGGYFTTCEHCISGEVDDWDEDDEDLVLRQACGWRSGCGRSS
jgi:hypothetical protein